MSDLINYVNSSFDEVISILLPVIKFAFISALFVVSLILLLGFLSHIFYVIFRYCVVRIKVKKVKSMLDKFGSFNSDQLVNYLRSLSHDDLKLICDYYGLDINEFFIKR